MKKLALIIVLTVIGLTSFAQLTLLHTFDGETTGSLLQVGLQPINEPVDGSCYYLNQFPELENKYVFCVEEETVIRYYIYNNDFSLNNSFVITPQLPENYRSWGCQYLSNHIINTDDEYEWLLTVSNYENGVYCDNNYIIITNGNIIYDLGVVGEGDVKLYKDNNYGNNQERIILVKRVEIYDNSYTALLDKHVDIYSCGGSLTRMAETKREKAMDAYPNPATSFINLPFELNKGETSTMNIYDINGRLIEQKPIGYHFKNLELNVSSYKAGTYIYEYNGKSNRFVVQ